MPEPTTDAQSAPPTATSVTTVPVTTTAPTTAPAAPPSAPPTTPPNPDPASQGDEHEDEGFDKARAMRTITRLRDFEKKSKELERELEAFKAKERERDEADLSQQAKLSKRVAELEAERLHESQQLQDERLSYQVELSAAKLGVIDADAAAKLMDRAAVEFDAQGRPTNVEKVLKSLVKDRPYLVKPAEPTTPATPPAPVAPPIAPTNGASGEANPTASGRRYSRAEINDFRFFKAHKDDILRAERDGRIDY